MLRSLGFILEAMGNRGRIFSRMITSGLPFGKMVLAVPCRWIREAGAANGEVSREVELRHGVG